MEKIRVLFACAQHGGRSRIAEVYASLFASDKIEAYSSSFEPGLIEPLPIAVMQEIGIDITAKPATLIYDRYKNKETFDYVITMCHGGGVEHFATFEKNVKVLYGKNTEILTWSIPDFRTLAGNHDEIMDQARRIRDSIKQEVENFHSRVELKTTAA